MSILIPVAHGSESLETVTLVNLLRRAGLEVNLSSAEPETMIKATRGIALGADSRLQDLPVTGFDAVILPGGEAGARRLTQSGPLKAILNHQRQMHGWYGGICAAPALTLSPLGLLDGKQATCYPTFRDQLLHFVDRPVVIDGHCITSQGPGTALLFALTWIEKLASADLRREVAQTALLAAA